MIPRAWVCKSQRKPSSLRRRAEGWASCLYRMSLGRSNVYRSRNRCAATTRESTREPTRTRFPVISRLGDCCKGQYRGIGPIDRASSWRTRSPRFLPPGGAPDEWGARLDPRGFVNEHPWSGLGHPSKAILKKLHIFVSRHRGSCSSRLLTNLNTSLEVALPCGLRIRDRMEMLPSVPVPQNGCAEVEPR